MAILTINRGLVTSPNELARPDGALVVADNCNIDFDNIIEPRRGFSEFGNVTSDDSLIKQVLTYKGRILRHFSNKLSFDSTGNGTFLNFSGEYSELVSKLRIKYIELNSNLYFTTSTGIKKISATSADDFTTDAGFITDAGAVKAVGFEAKIDPTSSGFLPAQSKVAYKILWAIKDANSNVIRGVPSSRVVVSNTSTDLNVGEKFLVTIVNKALILGSKYFLFDCPTNQYAVWFNVTGTDTAPVDAAVVGRRLVEVNIKDYLASNDTVAAKLATALYEITDIVVGVTGNEVTISNVDSGNVANSSQGTLSASAVLVSTVYDGQTSIGIPANVNLNIVVPSGVTASYFYEVYRTAIITTSLGLTLNDIDPGTEFQKIYEAPVTTTGGVVDSFITYNDIVPETFRESGAYLYTNPVSGESDLQANEQPPIANDVAIFKGSAFYANTKQRHRTQFNILSVSDFTSGTSEFIIGNSDKSVKYTFVGRARVLKFTPKKKSDTLGNSYFLLNSAQDRITYKVYFDKGVISHNFLAADMNIALNKITINNHGYADKEKVSISGTTSLAAGTYYIVKIDDNSFSLSTSAGGSVVDLTVAEGGTIVHTPITLLPDDGTISIRIALQTYDDTIQGMIDAVIQGFVGVSDFTIEDTGSLQFKLYNTDNGSANGVTQLPTQSTPAVGWVSPTVEILGLGEDASSKEVLLSGLDSVSLSIEDTARSLERVINQDPDSPVNAFYTSSVDQLPGTLVLESRSLYDDHFYIGTNDSNIKSKFNPELPVSLTITTISSAGVFTTSTNHSFSIGQQVYINDNLDGSKVEFSGKYIIATKTLNTFTLSGIGSAIPQSGILGVVFAADVESDNSVNQNRIYFSKISQPEAVPLANYIDIGPKDKSIQRIMALRDSLIVLKEEGVYVVTGPSAPNFTVRLADSSALTYAPDTATNLNNLIYVLTSQGVVTASETGIGVISRNIEDSIQEVTNAKFDYKLTSWGMSSESDRCYLLFLPSRVSDTVATQAYRYNTFTRAWTRWTKAANCGVVNAREDKMYLGDASGRNYILQERKNFERQDYADREIERSIASNAINGTTYTLSSVAELSAGDVLVQQQYVDINKFNRLLKKLKKDSFSNTDYTTLKASIGDSIGVKLSELSAMLQADGIMVPTSSGSDALLDIKDDYNAIIDYLNSSGSGTGYKNYKNATDLLTYETLITDVNLRANTVSVKFTQNFIQGLVSIFKGINSIIQYAPQHFGKPESTKQIPEGTFIFDQNNFWGGTVGYSSDRSFDFKTIDFSAKGPGYWDGYSWASTTFGGEGNEVPVRTLIPRDKARCRYLHVQFTHINAREKWKLLGVSLEPREVSSRGYR